MLIAALLTATLTVTLTACGSVEPVGIADDRPTTTSAASGVSSPEVSTGTSIVDGSGGAFFVGGYRQSGHRVRLVRSVVPLTPTTDPVDDLPFPADGGFVFTGGMTTPRGIYLIGLACSWHNMETPGCQPTAESAVFLKWSFESARWSDIALPDALKGTTAVTIAATGDGRAFVAASPRSATDWGATPAGSETLSYWFSETTQTFSDVSGAPPSFRFAASAGASLACVAGSTPVVAATTGVGDEAVEAVMAYDGSEWVQLFEVPAHRGLGFAIACSDRGVAVVVPDGGTSYLYFLDAGEFAPQSPERRAVAVGDDISALRVRSIGDAIFATDGRAESAMVLTPAAGDISDATVIAEGRFDGLDRPAQGSARLAIDGDRIVRLYGWSGWAVLAT